jgi:hypothetical protein
VSELLCLLRYDELNGCCLCLDVDASDHLLWDVNTYPPDLQLSSSADRPDVTYELQTIRQFLTHVELGPQAKRYMQIILARSILPLLQGLWVEQSLTSKDIFILCAIDHNGLSPSFDKLFVSTRFERSNKTRSQVYAHPLPAVLALGTLLAEIELGDKLEEVYQAQNLDGAPPKRVGDVLYNECQIREQLPGGALQSIRFCIEPRSFWGVLKRPKTRAPQHDRDFAKHYYANIIRPLEEDMMKGSKWSLEEATLQIPRSLERGIVRVMRKAIFERNEPNQVTDETYRRQPILLSIAEEVACSSITSHHVQPPTLSVSRILSDARMCEAGDEKLVECQSVDSNKLLTLCRPLQTEDWFQELRDCHTVLDRDRILPVKPKKLVKVAVLDTGVDLTNPKLQKLQRDGRLDVGIDLVDEGKTITDRDGHGTHVCHTLHQTAPWAKLYPIRVFRRREADDLTASLVVKV